MEELIRKSDAIKAILYTHLDNLTPEERRQHIEAIPAVEPNLLDDGTLVVTVEDATKVGRVLVEDDHKNGSLYYADSEPKRGKWEEVPYKRQGHEEIVIDGISWRCTNCGSAEKRNDPDMKFCPNCGARMKCCGNCEYRRQSKLKIQFNEIPITAYCDNENSPYYDKYVWDDDVCRDWKGTDNEHDK